MTDRAGFGVGRRDPYVLSVAALGCVIAGGFVLIALGWRAVARTLSPPLQLPALVSGGLVGLALVVSGCAVVAVQVRRRAAAISRLETERLLEEAHAVLQAAVRRRERPAQTPLRPTRGSRRAAPVTPERDGV